LAAPLVAASTPVRRFAVSTLIVLHFAAIFMAVMSAPPGPWIVGQAQHWLFRTYIDFTYLGNAYRFYSPEPGPASQLWCRIEYEVDGKPGISHWTKIPDLNEQGEHTYAMSLQYTRRLSLTENVARISTVSMMAKNERGEPVLPDFIKRRDRQAPTPLWATVLGEEPVEGGIKVPYYPESDLNYKRPTLEARQFLASYARHLLLQPHPENPNARPVAVKIYRVQHQIIPAVALAAGADPADLSYYFPYYMGRFDSRGQILDPRDPFLYWLLPMEPENLADPNSRLRCYVFLHAGDDRDWIRDRPKKK
jgi:hypothetical protein